MKWVKATAIQLGEGGKEGAAIEFELDYKLWYGEPLRIDIGFKNDPQGELPEELRKLADKVEATITDVVEKDKAKRHEQAEKEASPIKSLVCEICHEIIGMVDMRKLAIPLMGSMVKSKDPVHGAPDPFPAAQTWEFMRCPYCRKRPFIITPGDTEAETKGPQRLLTTEGYVTIEVKEDFISSPPPGAILGEIRQCSKCDFWRVGQQPSGTGWCDLAKIQMDETRLCNLSDEEFEQLKGSPSEALKESGPPTEQETHRCEVCGREFTKRMALVGHMKAHKGEKK